MQKVKFKIGDLVSIAVPTGIEGLPIHASWNINIIDLHTKIVDRFLPNEVGVVVNELSLESFDVCRILVIGGERTKIGWSKANYLRAV